MRPLIQSPKLRRRLEKSLDDLDREMQTARLANSLDCPGRPDGRLDVDALASTEELRLIISLHLDGWTWPEINRHLRSR